jgi:pimeloyl-ACP methyl ester carboxylesterase
MGFFRVLRTFLGLFSTLTGGWLAYSSLVINHKMNIGSAIPTMRLAFHGKNSCLLSYYADTSASGRPLVLLHSINAAGSGYEVRPIFEQYRGTRPIYALDLPGFGFSERSDREYSITLYVNAIVDFLRYLDSEPADVIALSLTSEFAARAALLHPELFHSLTLISPTGFTQRENRNAIQQADSNGTTDSLYRAFSNPLWSQAFYDLLVIKPSIRFFLGQSFAGNMDDGLAEYSYLTTHQPGARYAPLYFVSGKLFSWGILDEVYRKLVVPVLVLYDTDPNITFDRLPEMVNQDNWRLRRIPGTRGLPHFERMDKVAEALNEFWMENRLAK